jgi:ATP-dependent RNA helicase RhlE
MSSNSHSHTSIQSPSSTAPASSAPSFSDLRLIEPLVRAVAAEGYTSPTPIQAKAIPHLVDGRDLVGCARTGTGKTAAFALPILQRLHQKPSHPGQGHHRPVRCLVLTPTRELAAQVGDSFASYGKNLHLKHSVIFGGVGQDPQVKALRNGVDILVATPGRLLDLLEQGLARLDQVEIFVLDEADRMLDMGFIHDVRRVIAKLPKDRQTLLFSATMPDEIRALAQNILRDPVRVEVAPVSSTAEKIDQSVWFVDKAGKRGLLEKLLADPSIARTLVFTRTKHGANRLAGQLAKANITAEAIHGNKSQGARERALGGFKRGDVRVLVATDIAARGIDVDGVTHVFNYDLPDVPEQYVHRIGRTARAGASGVAVSFCDGEERPLLHDIEKLIKAKVRVAGEVARTSAAVAAAAEREDRESRAAAIRQSGRGGRGSERRRGDRGPRAAGNSGGGASASPQRREGNPQHRDNAQRREGGQRRDNAQRRDAQPRGNAQPRRSDQQPAGGDRRRKPSVADVMAFWNR